MIADRVSLGERLLQVTLQSRQAQQRHDIERLRSIATPIACDPRYGCRGPLTPVRLMRSNGTRRSFNIVPNGHGRGGEPGTRLARRIAFHIEQHDALGIGNGGIGFGERHGEQRHDETGGHRHHQSADGSEGGGTRPWARTPGIEQERFHQQRVRVRIDQHPAIEQSHAARGERRMLGTVRHHHQVSCLHRSVRVVAHHLQAMSAVEVAGGLVCQQQCRARGNGARNGHTLLLAATQLAGMMIGAMSERQALENFGHALTLRFRDSSP